MSLNLEQLLGLGNNNDPFNLGNNNNNNSFLNINKLGNNNSLLNGLQLGLGGVNTLGNLFLAYKQNQLADKAFNFQTNAFNTNLNNQKKSYNTKLEDIIRARYNTEGKTQQEADAYINNHKL